MITVWINVIVTAAAVCPDRSALSSHKSLNIRAVIIYKFSDIIVNQSSISLKLSGEDWWNFKAVRVGIDFPYFFNSRFHRLSHALFSSRLNNRKRYWNMKKTFGGQETAMHNWIKLLSLYPGEAMGLPRIFKILLFPVTLKRNRARRCRNYFN